MMPDSEITIFISYRRSGDLGFVGRLTDRLSIAYGEKNVFRDISGLRSGDDFEKRIGRQLSQATVVIAVIDTNWVGKRRFRKSKIFRNDDWVRKEIEHALASETPIIPVLSFETALPFDHHLPSSLKGLLSVHTARIRDDSWDSDCLKLIKDIERVVHGPQSQDSELPFLWRRFEPRELHHRRTALSIAALVALPFMAYIVLIQNQPPSRQRIDTVQLKNPSTWISPQPTKARSGISHLALQLALFELHASTKEAKNHPGGNDGYNVEKFFERFRMKGIGWSAAFAAWCYLEAIKRTRNDVKATLPFTDSPSTNHIVDSLRSKGWLIEPFNASKVLPGDLVFFGQRITGEGMRWYHTEIVYAVDSKTICSIGGNVGESGNRDGDRVGGKCREIESSNIAAAGAIPGSAFIPPPL